MKYLYFTLLLFCHKNRSKEEKKNQSARHSKEFTVFHCGMLTRRWLEDIDAAWYRVTAENGLRRQQSTLQNRARVTDSEVYTE